MIHLDFYKKEKILLGYNTFEINGKTQYEFLGEVGILPLNDEIIQLDHPVARPTFGLFMYQMAAMFAKQENKHICLTRDGDIREEAVNPMKKIWSNVGNKISSINVPEEYNDEFYDFTDENEFPVFFEAFQIEETDAFKQSIRILESKEDSTIPKDILNEWNEFFRDAYENSNEFIKTEYELAKPLDLSEFLSFKPKIKARQNRLKYR